MIRTTSPKFPSYPSSPSSPVQASSASAAALEPSGEQKNKEVEYSASIVAATTGLALRGAEKGRKLIQGKLLHIDIPPASDYFGEPELPASERDSEPGTPLPPSPHMIAPQLVKIFCADPTSTTDSTGGAKSRVYAQLPFNEGGIFTARTKKQ